MRLLWVTTKPPWPAIDGGRLVAALTVEALAGAGHQVEVLSPRRHRHESFSAAPTRPNLSARSVPAASPPRWRAALAAALGGPPLSIARHDLAAVRGACARALDDAAPPCDVVVAEQLQALAQCQPAFARGVPVVLRAQNVESDLWAAAHAPLWLRPFLRREARRLARYEGEAVRRVAATLALSAADAARLGELARRAGADRADVRHVPAPFPAEWPAAETPLPGAPALVLFGSAGWQPNAVGAAWFVERVWPAVRQALPAAQLHVFGALGARPRAGIVAHAAPHDSRAAFAPGCVCVVPLHVASGVRVRILEAWARGVPVVATPRAAAGLAAEDGRELLLAGDAGGFARALQRLAASPDLGAALARAARQRLRAAHDPDTIAGRIATVLAGLRRAA